MIDVPSRITSPVLDVPVDVIDWDQALKTISVWADERVGRYVCITNVHSVVTATLDKSFHRVLAEADLVTPDGAPVAWMIRRQGHSEQKRINGPDLMLRYLAVAEARGEGVFLYGSTTATLDALLGKLSMSFPKLIISGTYSPPFRVLTPEEEAEAIQKIVGSQARTVWVSLGCPKQEFWMARHRGLIPAVMIGVGAAFDYHAGLLRRAPLWMQRSGLEWLYRLASEPRRLAKRYLITNSIFIFKAAAQLLSGASRRR